jgi:hypothetical protein
MSYAWQKCQAPHSFLWKSDGYGIPGIGGMREDPLSVLSPPLFHTLSPSIPSQTEGLWSGRCPV